MAGLLDAMSLVLVRTQGPVNLGMVGRLCGNLGVKDLRLVAPKCEINCAETRMFATHSRDLVLNAPVFPDMGAAVADRTLVIGTSARNRAEEYGRALALSELPAFLAERSASRWAMVFGNEADGLNDGEMIHCQAWVHLDTFGDNTSYNLSHAVGISLYHVATANAVPPAEAEPSASRESIDRLFAYWLASLERFQYFRRTERVRFAPQLKRLFNRLDLSDHDVQVLWGMLAQFNYFSFGQRGLPERETVLRMLAEASAREDEQPQ